jgi:murein hydrolase activator
MIIRRLLCIGLLLALAPGAPAQDDGLARVKERELEQVRERISELKERMDARAAERDRLAVDLQEMEVRIAEKRLQIAELERQGRYSEKRIEELDGDIAQRESQLEAESRQLAAQVRAAYMNGRQERLKLLLNQHDPASLGRLMVYYRYLSDYRGENIRAVNAHIEELADLRAEARAERDRLAALAKARYDELSALNNAQEERQALLATLKQKMLEDGSEIERLAAEERDLSRLIAELTSILSDYPITSDAPFTTLKGTLTWPVAGALLHDFGQPRVGGGVKWNGVVLAAPRGREVRAVYHGRVVFADWLAGLGLLVIVDHGEGYMTLYGYNETILKSTGDWVAPGDVIATVGVSGGRQRPGLYFEIRERGQPVNPAAWVTRRPGG